MDPDVTLDEYVRQLITARSEEAIYRNTAKIGKRLLSADTCLVAAVADDELVVRARAPPRTHTDRETLPLSNGLFEEMAFVGSSHVFDDIADVRGSASERSPSTAGTDRFRSLLLAPIEEEGFLVAAAHDRGAFTDYDQEWAEQLAAWMTTALQIPSTPRTPDPRRNGDSSDLTGRTDRLELVARVLSRDTTGPLSVVRGSLELAEATGEAAHYERARTALDRLTRLLDEAASLARTGGHVGQLEAVDLRRACEAAWAAIERGDASLEVEESRTIVADGDAISQLLFALFENAIARGGDGVTITVGVLETGFYVADDGPGIPPEERGRPLEWGHAADDRDSIGLAVVDEIVAAHGWDLAVGEGPDGGARFEITGIDDNGGP